MNVKCPYCRGTSKQIFTRYQRRYLRCRECGLMHVHPEDWQETSYSSQYAEQWEREWRGQGRQEIYTQVLSLLPDPPSGNLVDVGSGGGALLAMARQAGWEVWGIDPSAGPESWVQTEMKGRIVPSLQHLPSNTEFRAVSIVNVLDQIPEPWLLLRQLPERLHQDAIMVVRLPNCRLHRWIHQIAARLPGWFGRRILRFSVMHDYGLEPAFLRRMFSDAGFRIIRILPAATSSGDIYRQGSFFLFCKRFAVAVCRFINSASAERLIISPSILIVADRAKVS